MAVLSLALTALSLLTFWLVVPMFVLPPLAFYFGYKGYRRRHGAARTGRTTTFLSALPMVLAVAAFVLELTLMNVGYQA